MTPERASTPFDELGGELPVRFIIDRFVDRMFEDTMIGFFFRNADRQRIKDKEYEHAARLLGADLPYTGRPLREAHAPHGIFGGQFQRRMKILEETLVEHEVPPAIRELWLSHTEKLRSLVTRDAGSQCR